MYGRTVWRRWPPCGCTVGTFGRDTAIFSRVAESSAGPMLRGGQTCVTSCPRAPGCRLIMEASIASLAHLLCRAADNVGVVPPWRGYERITVLVDEGPSGHLIVMCTIVHASYRPHYNSVLCINVRSTRRSLRALYSWLHLFKTTSRSTNQLMMSGLLH